MTELSIPDIGGLIAPDLDGVFEILAQRADAAPCCPVAQSLALIHTHNTERNRRLVLGQIARNDAEPWAQQVASDWLRENLEV